MRPIAVTACLLALATTGAAGALAVTDRGTRGDDRLVGGAGKDELRGRGGADVLIGHRGADVLIGGDGPDRLRGGPGRDGFNMRDGIELAAPGDDRIEARDGRSDEISCGAGDDLAIVDAVEEGVYDCERISEPS
jgi:Ca2+-binding RTX toxin-like protein